MQIVAVDVVDLARRDTELGLEVDDETHAYATACYHGNGDYVGLVYQCANCLKPVRLPEGMVVDDS